MTLPFSQIFWGLLLVILDLKVNQLDLLPDFLGFILIAFGARRLAPFSPQFRTAHVLSWVLCGLSLIGIFLRGNAGSLYSMVVTGLDCWMMWCLLGGMMDYSTAQGRPDLAEMARRRRLAYVIILAGLFLTAWVVRVDRGLASAWAVGFLVALVVLMVLILHLLHRIKNEVAAAAAPPAPLSF